MKKSWPSSTKEDRSKKRDKERIGEVSERIKKCIRGTKRRRGKENPQKISEELRGSKNISNIKSAKKRILILKNQEHGRRNHHNEKRHRRRSRRVSTQKLYDDDEGEEDTTKNEDEATKIEEKCHENKQKNLRTSSKYQSSRRGKSKTRLAVSSEGKQETAVGSEQNRSKNCDEGTKRVDPTGLQRDSAR